MSAEADTKPAAEAEAPATTGAATPATPFAKLAGRLSVILKDADYSEMWGVDLQPENIDGHVPTKVVLQKFLRANNNEPEAAETQLKEALEWRKKTQPAKLVGEVFDEKKYGGLGYVTVHKPSKDGERDTVITWNIYGAVKDNKKTFGDVEDFIKWRAALMELGVQKLNLPAITSPLEEGGEDPYQMIQVHDYLSVSFFKLDPHVKAASSQIIKTFGMAYPELLAHKYFVNVPMVMGWMYAAMKLFLAPATLKKFHPMSSGKSLAAEMPGVAQDLPKEYGGAKGNLADVGEYIKMKPFEDQSKKEEIPVAAEDAPVAAVKEDDKPVEKPKAEESTPVAAPKTEEAAPVAAVKTQETAPDVKVEDVDKVKEEVPIKAEEAPVAAVKEEAKPAQEAKASEGEKKDAA